jgi:2-haloacid dehalogenase
VSSATSTSITPISVEAIAFDLLSALNSAVELFERAAVVPQIGQTWHANLLRTIASTGSYVPFEWMLNKSANETGIPGTAVGRLLELWGEMRMWPDTAGILAKLAGHRLAIVTNCSQQLAETATNVTGTSFELVMSAEQAGAYKPDSRAYQAALTKLGLQPHQILFVAGSVYDVSGAGALGMPVYWANRYHASVPAGAPAPLFNAPDLTQLPALLGI